VSELAGPASVSALERAARDDPEADTATDRDRQDVVLGTAPSVEPFADRERVDVVVDEDGDPETVLQFSPKRDGRPAEDRRLDHAFLAVDDAGHTQTDAEQA
jgi:hypothetical protein